MLEKIKEHPILSIIVALATVLSTVFGYIAITKNQEVKVTVAENDAANARVAQLAGDNGTLKAENGTLKGENAKLQGEIATLQGQVDTLAKQVEDFGGKPSVGGTSNPPARAIPAVRRAGTLQASSQATGPPDLDATDADWGRTAQTGDGRTDGPGLGRTDLSTYNGAKMVLATGTNVGYWECAEQANNVNKDVVQLSEISPGSTLCVKTTAGRYALLKVNGEPTPQVVKFDVTIWEKAA